MLLWHHAAPLARHHSDMLLAAVTPISGHAVFLLMVQLALLLVVARLGAGLARMFGLPAVVGELAAGIVLGPSVFGHYAPKLFLSVFPQTTAQFHLLETVGILGMVLLLLLTGLETDLKLLRNLGRAAVVASVLGMLVPFGLGYLLGLWMPEEFLAQPDRRHLFAAFMATAIAISAMPVIAKILMDLDLMRRNIGLVILSAGVVDDTAGWLILSVIAGAATHGGGLRLAGLGFTVMMMFLFLLGMALIAYPLLRVVMRALARAKSLDSELVLIVAFTFVCAALTELIGVHAVFGAFIAGTLLRQLPDLKQDTVHRLESFIFAILAPIFFGTVGLRVDLWTLTGADGLEMLGIVLGIACLGKLLGCTIGGLWGGMSFWEALSIAMAMNARGAMGLVVAIIGLSLGILNEQMFSIIVVVAIATSFIAPVALRLTMRMVRMTRDEEQRILAEQSRGVFDPVKVRVLVPTAGGPNALVAVKLACGFAGRSQNPIEVVHVDEKGTAFDRVLRLILGETEAGKNVEQHLAAIRAIAGDRPVRVRRMVGRAAGHAVVDEASKGYDVVMAGASGKGSKVGGRVLEDIVEAAPCHVAIVKAGTGESDMKRVFVPIDGSMVSRTAAEFALHYAETTGAELTLGLLSERRVQPAEDDESKPDMFPGRKRRRTDLQSMPPPMNPAADPPPRSSAVPDSPEEELIRISAVFRISSVKPTIRRIDYDPGLGAVADAIVNGKFDLVVLGAENRAVRRRLFFGHENELILALEHVTTLILVPHRSRRH